MLNKKKLNLTSSAVLLASAPALALQAHGEVDGVAGLASKELAGKSLNNAVTTVVKVVGFVVVVVALGYLLYYIANRMSSSKGSLSDKVEQKENTDETKIKVDTEKTLHRKEMSVNGVKISTNNQKEGGFGLEPSIMNEEILLEESGIEENAQKSNKKEIENKDQIIKDLKNLNKDLIGNKGTVFDRKSFSALEKDYKEYLDKMETSQSEAKKCEFKIDHYKKIEGEKLKELDKVIYDLRKFIVSIKILMCQLNLEKLNSQEGIGGSVQSDEETKLQKEWDKLKGEVNEKYNHQYVPKVSLGKNIRSCLSGLSKLEKIEKYEDFPDVGYLVEYIFDCVLSKPELVDWKSVCNNLSELVENLEKFKEGKIKLNIENNEDFKKNEQKLSEAEEEFNKARNKIVEDLENDESLPYLDLGENLLYNKIEG